MKSYVVGGILAGIILFIWTAISWMALPWHVSSLNSFKDEKAVSEVIVTNAPKSGVYVLPMQMMDSQGQGPVASVFTAVNLEGMSSSMAKPMIVGLLVQIIAAILIGALLSYTVGLSYMGRVLFVITFAFAASLITHVPYWNWFSFETGYTIVEICDLLIGWTFAGLILAKFYRPRVR